MALRLTIRTKLALGGVAILAPFLLAAPSIHSASRDIVDGVIRMSRLDGPASAALHDMERALARTALVLDASAAEPLPASLERLRSDERDFRGAYRTWRALVQGERERTLAMRIEGSYDAYFGAALALVQARGAQSELLDRFLASDRTLDNLLARGVQSLAAAPAGSRAAALATLLALQASARRVALGVTQVLRSGDPAHESALVGEVREFGGQLARYQALPLGAEPQRWAGLLRHAHAEAAGLATGIVAQRHQLQEAWSRAVEARQAVDALLDRDLERQLEAEAARSHADVLGRARRGTTGVFVLIALAAALAAAVTALTARSLRRPLHELLAAIEAVRAGDLSRRAAVCSSDETAQLVVAFNRMADDLQSTNVSRRYVEGIIRSMSESLIVVDADGLVLTANPAACVLLGYREPALVGAPFASVLEPWPEVAAQAALAPVHDLETHYRTRDGRVVPVLLYADRVVVADGRGPAIVCVALDMTELVRSREQVARSRERLRALARHLNATVEAERTAIAREVHDQLGQAMTCLKLDVHRLRDELARADAEVAQRVRPRLGAMAELIDESVRTVRKIATDLRPAALDDLGLGPALEALAERFGERTGIRCAVEEADAVALSTSQATALYRIAQEALTNAARHAHATRVALRLRAEAGAVVLEVEDNGRGITPSEVAAARSLGLLGMEERAHEQGASVTIDGASGRGTTVRVELALEGPAAAPAPPDAPAPVATATATATA